MQSSMNYREKENLICGLCFYRMKSIQSKLEYLFYCAQPLRRDQNNHMHQFTTIESISEHGFPNVELYKVCSFFVSLKCQKMIFD
jgi:hypothetical protein